MIILNDSWGCRDYSGFANLQPGQTLLKPPCRSPLVIVEVIKPYITGKVVCELGSACGDLSLEMAKFAKKVIGIEYDPKRVEISRKRGVYTIYADMFSLPPLPGPIDVYYLWSYHFAPRKMLGLIEKGVLIMAGEVGEDAEGVVSAKGRQVKILEQLHAENPGSHLLEVKYNEGDGIRQSGTFILLIVEKWPIYQS